MIYIHLAEGFEEIEALTPCDLLRRVGVEAKTVSVTGEKMVTGAHSIRVEADLLFEEADYDSCSMIVLPGGLPGAFNLQDHAGLEAQIKRFAEEDRPLAAICAAPLVFGSHGVLNGRKATIYPGMEKCLNGALPQDEIVVQDGKVITSMGPATAMPFALKLIEALKGKEVSDSVADGLLWNRL